MRFLNNLSLSHNQLIDARLQMLGNDPSDAVEGQFYYNSASGVKRLEVNNGTSFKQVAWLSDLSIDSNLSSAAQTAISNTHTHVNKALLDTYTQTNANIADAITKKHSQNTDSGTNNNSFSIGDGLS